MRGRYVKNQRKCTLLRSVGMSYYQWDKKAMIRQGRNKKRAGKDPQESHGNG
jgi:hypothetical protein